MHKPKRKSKAKSKNRGRSAGSAEEVVIRTMRFPYVDSVLLVDESLKVAHNWSPSLMLRVTLMRLEILLILKSKLC